MERFDSDVCLCAALGLTLRFSPWAPTSVAVAKRWWLVRCWACVPPALATVAQGGRLGTRGVGRRVPSPLWRVPQIPVESGGGEGAQGFCLKSSTVLGSRYWHLVPLGTGLPRKMDVTVARERHSFAIAVRGDPGEGFGWW